MEDEISRAPLLSLLSDLKGTPGELMNTLESLRINWQSLGLKESELTQENGAPQTFEITSQLINAVRTEALDLIFDTTTLETIDEIRIYLHWAKTLIGKPKLWAILKTTQALKEMRLKPEHLGATLQELKEAFSLEVISILSPIQEEDTSIYFLWETMEALPLIIEGMKQGLGYFEDPETTASDIKTLSTDIIKEAYKALTPHNHLYEYAFLMLTINDILKKGYTTQQELGFPWPGQFETELEDLFRIITMAPTSIQKIRALHLLLTKTPAPNPEENPTYQQAIGRSIVSMIAQELITILKEQQEHGWNIQSDPISELFTDADSDPELLESLIDIGLVEQGCTEPLSGWIVNIQANELVKHHRMGIRLESEQAMGAQDHCEDCGTCNNRIQKLIQKANQGEPLSAVALLLTYYPPENIRDKFMTPPPSIEEESSPKIDADGWDSAWGEKPGTYATEFDSNTYHAPGEETPQLDWEEFDPETFFG
jgi:hypothetical protein